MDTVMTDDHILNEALTEMLLSSTSSATNLMSLKESIPLQVLVVDFMLASHD